MIVAFLGSCFGVARQSNFKLVTDKFINIQADIADNSAIEHWKTKAEDSPIQITLY